MTPARRGAAAAAILHRNVKPIRLPLALTALLVSALGTQPQKFVLAIVRLDGRLVPFAAYDGGRWERAWPEADEATDGSRTIDDTPSIWRRHGERVPNVWRVWPAAGGSPRHAHVKGVVVDSNLAIGSIEDVRRSDVLWKTAERAVLAGVATPEAAQARADDEQLRRETPVPVADITALYREAKSRRSLTCVMAEIAGTRVRYPLTVSGGGC
jgi:hypothetical protein